jgi:hypothetical protein
VDDRIFKYDLAVEQRQMFMLPCGAEFLSATVINEQPVIFALIRGVDDVIWPPERRIIRIARTGERFNSERCRYIDSLYFDNGHTFHVFEQFEGSNDPLESRFKPDYEETRRGPE